MTTYLALLGSDMSPPIPNATTSSILVHADSGTLEEI
jgi:hypothetical protein